MGERTVIPKIVGSALLFLMVIRIHGIFASVLHGWLPPSVLDLPWLAHLDQGALFYRDGDPDRPPGRGYLFSLRDSLPRFLCEISYFAVCQLLTVFYL